MKTLGVSLLVLLLLPACSSPVVPIPLSHQLFGSVTETPGGRVQGVAIRITDGANAGQTTVTDASGVYRFVGLESGAAHISASTGYADSVKEVFITGNAALDFTFTPPLFYASGSGNFTIDVPARVTRARVIATYYGKCAFFSMVNATGYSFVNDIVGTATVNNQCDTAAADYYASGPILNGVHELRSNGGKVKVNAEDAAWSFEEVR